MLMPSLIELTMIALACIEPIAGKAERMKAHIKQCKNLCDDERTLALLTASKSTPRLPQNPIRPLLRDAADAPTSNPPLLSSPQILADVQTTTPASTGRKLNFQLMNLF